MFESFNIESIEREIVVQNRWLKVVFQKKIVLRNIRISSYGVWKDLFFVGFLRGGVQGGVTGEP